MIHRYLTGFPPQQPVDTEMDSDLRNMVMSFRVTELQTLLAYAGKNRSGRKNELQARALELVKSKSSPIVSKIKELYRSTQQSMTLGGQSGMGTMPQPQQGSYSSGVSNGGPYNQVRQPYNSSSGYGGTSDKVLQGISSAFMFNAQRAAQPLVTMPICPDVKMKRLPFYDIMSELVKPSSLLPHGMNRSQEASFPFCLTPTQASDISESRDFVPITLGDQKLQYTVQVQLRFCSLDTSTAKEQDDQFPPNLVVKVNTKLVPLPHPIPSNRPGVEPKRPSRPLNITNFVRLSPTTTNNITVTWASDNSRGHAMCVYLVKKLTSSDLLSRLKQKGPRPADYSRGLIKELIAKDDGDCMIAMTSLKVSIACPLGKSRMSLPCRATTCKHLQCFDANLFLQMNERKPTWICPVCDKTTLFDDLSIDGYFQEVISKMSGSESMDVELLPDGKWKMLAIKPKDKDDCSPPTKKMKSDTQSTSKMNQTINLDDDIVIEEIPLPKSEPGSSSATTPPPKEAKKDSGPAVVIDLTLSSDEEEEEDVPVVRPRREKGKKPNYVIEDDSSNSSSSSATTDASADTRPATPVAPLSPACITLDSRSPSPEVPPPRPMQTESSNHQRSTSSSSATTGGGPFGSSNREVPTGGPMQHEGRSTNSSTTFDYGHTLGHSSGYARSNPSHTQPVSVSPNLFAPSGAGYLPYGDGQNIWGSSGSNSNSFQNPFPAPDFSQLEFNSMDYFSYDTRSNNNTGYRWP